MNTAELLDYLINKPDWANIELRACTARSMPSAFEELLNAETVKDAVMVLDRFDGHVYHNDGLHEAALYVVPIVLAALSVHKHPDFVHGILLEILFHIVNGDLHGFIDEDGIEHENAETELGIQCREAAREGLWLLYRELETKHSADVTEIIQILDPDHERRIAKLGIPPSSRYPDVLNRKT